MANDDTNRPYTISDLSLALKDFNIVSDEIKEIQNHIKNAQDKLTSFNQDLEKKLMELDRLKAKVKKYARNLE